jgi:NAD dependent epimerase/dehydratase family enzyme
MPKQKKDKEAFVSVLNYTGRGIAFFWPPPHKSRLRPERLQTTQAMTGFLRVTSTENI